MASKDKRQPEKNDDSFATEMVHRFKAHPFLFGGTVVVLVIVIVAFVFVPAIVPRGGGRVRGGGAQTFGYYNGTPISYVLNNYFYRSQQYLMQRYQLSYDDPDFEKNLNRIWRQAFEETAIHLGILDEMKQSGFIVPEDVVDREMAELPQFQENGRFSSAKYRAMDNSTRLNLWKQVQESTIIESYLSDLNSLRTAPNESSFVSSMASPKRTFDLAAFPLISYPDSEVSSYVETNPDLFKIIRLSRITITSSEKEARQVLASINDGTTSFEEAAINNSQDWAADRGGDIGITMAYELEFEISDAQARESVMNLSRGEISDLIKVTTGWSFYRADEIAHPVDLSDQSQRNRVRNYIFGFQRGRAEDWILAEAEKFSEQVREDGFDEAITAANLVKRSFGPVPVNYGNSALFKTLSSSGITELENAGSNEFFWKAAFSTPLNTPSVPIVVGDTVIVLFPLEETAEEEEDEKSFIESYYSYWIGNSTESAYRSYFLNNNKLDDRFDETFSQIWRGN